MSQRRDIRVVCVEVEEVWFMETEGPLGLVEEDLRQLSRDRRSVTAIEEVRCEV